MTKLNEAEEGWNTVICKIWRDRHIKNITNKVRL